MTTLTPMAKAKLEEYLAEEPNDTVVRILIEEDGKLGLSLDSASDDDHGFEVEAMSFVIEGRFKDALEGLKIDYLDQGATSGFALTGGRPITPQVVRRVEPTPNPNAMKFVLGFVRCHTSKTYTTDDAEAPEFAKALLALEGVESVFELANFVTINRVDGTPWDQIVPKVRPILEQLEPPQLDALGGPASDAFEDRLAYFIRTDVAPFLQADGGDIELDAHGAELDDDDE